MKPQNSKSLFSGKIVWITGASSGIGAQLSRDLDRLGAVLILSARSEAGLHEVNQSLPMHPGEAMILPIDLEKLDELPAKVSLVLSKFGSIDYLIHNAGVAVRDYALATDLSVDQKLMRINYFGPVCLTKQVLPAMLRKGSGHIVVISSLSAKYGIPRTAAYAASKHALHGFFETLRSEIAGKGISITLIIPGIIKTEITAHALKGDGSPFEKMERTFQEGYPLDKAARRMVNAILQRREEVFVGGSEGLTLVINRVWPWLLRRIIRNHPLKALRRWKQQFGFRKAQMSY